MEMMCTLQNGKLKSKTNVKEKRNIDLILKVKTLAA